MLLILFLTYEASITKRALNDDAFKRAILHSRLDPAFPGVESSRRLRQLRLSDRPRCSTIIVTAPLSGIRTVLCNEHYCEPDRKSEGMPFCNHLEERHRSTFPFSCYRFGVSQEIRLEKVETSDSKTLRDGRRDVKMERSILTPL